MVRPKHVTSEPNEKYPRGLDGAPYASPGIDLIAGDKRQLYIVVGRCLTVGVAIVRAVLRLAGARNIGRCTDGGKEKGTGDAG